MKGEEHGIIRNFFDPLFLRADDNVSDVLSAKILGFFILQADKTEQLTLSIKSNAYKKAVKEKTLKVLEAC